MISESDIAGFFSTRELLKGSEYIEVDFYFETDLNPHLVAAGLCAEQSTAQWKRPGVNEDLRPRFAAKVIAFEAKSQNTISEVSITVAQPTLHFGDNLPIFLSFIAGEGAFYCPGVKTLRVLDVRFPESFLKLFKGPRFGIEGLREQLQIFSRPFYIGVVKPNLGLSSADFAEIAFQSYLGGLDIAKDDEMLVASPVSSREERVRLVMQKLKEAEAQTQVRKLFIANLTDEVSRILPGYQALIENGGNAAMLNGYFTGFSALRLLSEQSTIPVMGHFTGMAIYDHSPKSGIDGKVLIKLQRLCGCDLIVFPGFGDRMGQTDDQVLRHVAACLEPMGSIKKALPIPGGSDWAGTLPEIFEKVGHTDFGFIAGRGVYGHPQGPKAGAQSLHDAWDAISKKQTLAEAAKTKPALAAALDVFNK